MAKEKLLKPGISWKVRHSLNSSKPRRICRCQSTGFYRLGDYGGLLLRRNVNYFRALRHSRTFRVNHRSTHSRQMLTNIAANPANRMTGMMRPQTRWWKNGCSGSVGMPFVLAGGLPFSIPRVDLRAQHFLQFKERRELVL